MLTLFTLPKAFQGHIGLIQRNALQSWKALKPAIEIILFGDDPGVREAAAEFGVRHIPTVGRSALGTPLLDGVFRQAIESATHPTLCFINADILLLDDFMPTVGRVQMERFFMTGRRWMCDVTEPIDFTRSDWCEDFRRKRDAERERQGKSFRMGGIDYFVFRKGCGYENTPPLAVGRGVWPKWLIYNARRQNIPVVDSTAMVLSVHQNHDHTHVRNVTSGKWTGPESKENQRLAGPGALYGLNDATHEVTPEGVREVPPPGFWGRLDRRFRYRTPLFGFFSKLFRYVRKGVWIPDSE